MIALSKPYIHGHTIDASLCRSAAAWSGGLYRLSFLSHRWSWQVGMRECQVPQLRCQFGPAELGSRQILHP